MDAVPVYIDPDEEKTARIPKMPPRRQRLQELEEAKRLEREGPPPERKVLFG